MSKLLTRMQYAEYRKAKNLPGVTYQTVCVKVADKKITCIDNLINPEVADIEWIANTRTESYSMAQHEDIELRTKKDIAEGVPDYTVSKARIEAIKAIKEELTLQEMQGELVKVGEVYAELFDVIATLKGAIMLVPQRIAPEVAALSDIMDIEALMEKQLSVSLDQLSIQLGRSSLIKPNENT